MCDVSKPSANVWNIFLASPGHFPVARGGEKCRIYMRGCQTMYICDVSKPLANVWNIFQASTGDFPAVCVGRGGE